MTSTQSPPPGYWQASDGNWYPPESAPQPAEPSDKKRKKWPWVVGALVVLFGIGAASGGGKNDDGTAEKAEKPTAEQAVEKPAEMEAPDPAAAAPVEAPAATSPPLTAAPAIKTPPPAPPVEEPKESVSQANARRSAQNYLEMSGFSRSGLIEQLKFEGYSQPDAEHAVDSLTVDWNEQAARSAKNYLDMTAFSRSGLIDQLKFEGYSQSEAEHGASAVGL